MDLFATCFSYFYWPLILCQGIRICFFSCNFIKTLCKPNLSHFEIYLFLITALRFLSNHHYFRGNSNRFVPGVHLNVRHLINLFKYFWPFSGHQTLKCWLILDQCATFRETSSMVLTGKYIWTAPVEICRFLKVGGQWL